MFCSKCGAADQAADSYCKRCGEWLPDTSRLGRRRGRFWARTPEQRSHKMRFLEVVTFLFALSSIVIMALVLAGKLEKPALVVAIDLSLVTAVFQVINFLIGRSLQQRLRQGREEEAEKRVNLGAVEERPQLRPADTSNLAQPLSVTEGTTAILEPVPRRGRDVNKR